MERRGTSKKLHHLWSGQFKVLKRVSDSTYWIQQLQGRKQRRIVHFNQLKLCHSNIHLEDLGGSTSVNPVKPDCLPSLSLPDNASPVGHNLQLLDDPHDDERPAVATHAEEPDTREMPLVSSSRDRYPRREYRVPG